MHFPWLSIVLLGSASFSLAVPLPPIQTLPRSPRGVERRNPIDFGDILSRYNFNNFQFEQSPDAAQKCLENEIEKWLEAPMGLLSATVPDIIDDCARKYGYTPEVTKLPQETLAKLQRKSDKHAKVGEKLITDEEVTSETNARKKVRLEKARKYQKEAREEAEAYYGLPPKDPYGTGDVGEGDNEPVAFGETSQPAKLPFSSDDVENVVGDNVLLKGGALFTASMAAALGISQLAWEDFVGNLQHG